MCTCGTSKQPLSKHDLTKLQELAVSSRDIANELGNYRVRQEHGVNVYGLDDFPAEYVRAFGWRAEHRKNGELEPACM